MRVLLLGDSYCVDLHKHISAIAKSMGCELDVHLIQKAV